MASDTSTDLEVRRDAYGFAVFSGLVRVSKCYCAKADADARKDELLRKRQRTPRPCISGCGRTILSEGPHHRMCDPCRHRDAPGDWMSEIIS